MGKTWKRTRIRNKIAAQRASEEVVEEQIAPEVLEPKKKTIKRARKPKGKE